ncbi:Conserved oligomeric Golgi complex subunit 4 [Trichinella sp. T9]|nr:Conserved oligomeric Golgi complex subunit 4 [Trichinella sp. T9]
MNLFDFHSTNCFVDFFPIDKMLPFDFTNQLDQCRVELDRLNVDASALDTEIRSLLVASSQRARELASPLVRVEGEIATAESDFRQLANVFTSNWTLANGIGARVRRLDTAKIRVVDCMQLVDDALDSRLCVDGVQSSLAAGQYDRAADQLRRFLGVDAAVRRLASGDGAHDSTSLMLDARDRLRAILVDEFDRADRRDDNASVERFFKLFPLIGEHELGLAEFGAQLTRRLADLVQRSLTVVDDSGQPPFVDALRLLLDWLVRLIDAQQPIVDSCYGPGKLFVLWRLLQAQCDVEAGRILDNFFDHRQFYKKLSLAENCLKQSAASRTTVVDPLDLDAMLSEITLIRTCVQLYFKFVRRKVSIGIGKMPDETAKQKEEKQRLEEKFQTHLSNCVLNCRMQELLGQYVAIEEYYMRESILKAIRLECRESGTLLSSVVDDCFFIISKSVRRALATSDVDCICAMLNHACALLETHHLAHLKSRLKLGYPSSTGGLAEAYSTAAIAYASVVHQGKMSGAGGIGSGSGSGGASGGGGIGDSTTDKLREDYLTALNDCGVSVECVEKLKNRLKDDFRNVLLQLNDVDQQKLDSCLGQLDETANKFHSALSDAVDQLVRTSFKPRLRLAVDGFFNDTHAPSELEFVELESRGLFVENIIGCLQLLLEDLRQSLGERPLAMVHATTASLTADLLEKATLKGTYNRLGGLLLDKQIRKLAGYWTQFAGWSTRQRFSRLDQIVSLLNVDSVADAQDYCQSESVTWLLNLAEIRQVLALRIDLPGNEILDERLYPFKGRCQFRQYMPKKPAKYGIKFWVACCSKSSYAWNMQIYTGKPSSGTREKNQGMRVVLDMTDLLLGTLWLVD